MLQTDKVFMLIEEVSRGRDTVTTTTYYKLQDIEELKEYITRQQREYSTGVYSHSYRLLIVKEVISL